MRSVSDDLRDFLAKARGSAAMARVVRLDELERTRTHEQPTPLWGLAALRGRLVELSARGASATMTTAIELVLEAQREHEPVVWVVPWTTETSCGTFYPPDAAAAGIDLAALVVVRAPSVIAAARAVERVLRSGAFGLVVLDLGSAEQGVSSRLPDHVQGRLVTLAQAHDAAVVCLTDKTSETGSLGSLVSLRAEALRTRTKDGFEITVRALKDKRRGPGWLRARKARGPAGL
ncbi:MAG: recombinase A [Kofleriaceae bacterium]|nr:recombinase A [Kofleriaceae bacterium]